MVDQTAFDKFDITGKTAVVTAGGTGLGYHATLALMRSGAKVMIASRRENVLKEAAERLRSECNSGQILYHTVDLEQRDSLHNFAEHAKTTLEGVDIYIGNAALYSDETVENIQEDTMDSLLSVNLAANMLLTKAFLPEMRANNWGRIIFSSSAGSLKSGSEGMGVYAATKAALNSFARTVAAESGCDGITVNSIVFGVYMTDMLKVHMAQLDKTYGNGTGQILVDKISNMTAIGRLGNPDELEGLVQLLASDAGSYISGQSIPLDGTMTSLLWPRSTEG